MRFIDEEKQKILDRDGIIKIPFISDEKVAEFKEFIQNETPIIELSNNYGLAAGIFFDSLALKNELHQKISDVLLPICNSYLENYKPLIFTALVKGVGKISKLDIHQDWSVVDENHHRSLSLWIPLKDTNPTNGTVYAIKGSHKNLSNPRGGSIPSIFTEDVEGLMELMEPINVKAGEALIFYQNLVHFSPPNMTDEPRITLISSLVPEGADVLQYYLKDEDTVEVYKMNDNFFLQYDDFFRDKDQRPNGIKIGEVTDVHKVQNVLELIKSGTTTKKESIFKRFISKYMS